MITLLQSWFWPHQTRFLTSWVSLETSFNSKQPKLEPKLVSALSKIKRLFRFFCFYTETDFFDVLIKPKQTVDQPKQFDMEHILVPIFSGNLGFSVFFRFILVCFASIPKQRVSMFWLNRNKQKTNRISLTGSIFWYFYENLGLFRFVSKQLCLFLYRFETPKQTEIFSFWFYETNRNKPETDLVSVWTEFFWGFRGHPAYIFGAKPLSQLLVRQRVIFLVAGSSLVTLFFYPSRTGLRLCFYKLFHKVKLSASPASDQCFFE
jgi:hypothetical protein